MCAFIEWWDGNSPHAVGAYANYLSDLGSSRRRGGGDRLERLRALKDRYDSTNVFRLHAEHPAEP